MLNIRFIGRENELKKIREMQRRNFFLVVKGRRRIGKTRLLRTALPEALYVFVWPDKSLDWLLRQICTEYALPIFANFKDLLEYLFDKKRAVILDEFQNFLNIDKSVYGEIQKVIDERKNRNAFFKIAVAGSSYSLMNKVFNDAASPLYGRRTDEIIVEHLSFQALFHELKIPLEDLIKLCSVFEGIPYYYELIDKGLSAEKNIKSLVLSKEAQLQEEGKTVLSGEFGKDSKTYNTVLTGIAEGKTKLNELASLFGNKKNEVVKYLDILRKDFRLVKKMTPITENPVKSKEGRYTIIDNFLAFWFYFAERLRNYREQERFEEIERFFDENVSSYMGRKFEGIIIELIKQKCILQEFPFTSIGNQWGKTLENRKETYEIDLLSLNKDTKEILFGECKWSDNVDAEKILLNLQGKAENVLWYNNERKEQYALFAKSFKRKITSWDNKKVSCFDLKDIERLLS